MAKINQGQSEFQGSNIDAYNYYKKSPEATQQFLSSFGFNNSQDRSANMTNSVAPTKNTKTNPLLSIANPSFLTGLAIGVGIAFVATNPTIKNAVVAGAVKIWTNVQSNIEEVKEQIQDVRAELSKEDE